MAQRAKQTDGATYQPTLAVYTQRLRRQIELRIRDNGTGISEAISAKIFQPLFTTKPTGQGTGLGLSLSYDIIWRYAEREQPARSGQRISHPAAFSLN